MKMTKRTLYNLLAQGNLMSRIKNRIGKEYDYVMSYFRMHRVNSPERNAVFYGRNDDEENLLALAAAMSSSYRGEIVLLVEDEARTQGYLDIIGREFPGYKREKILLLTKSIGNIRKFHFNSEFVFTSHIILPSVMAPFGRLHVHVSHGLGPKTYRNFRSSENALVSNSRIWNNCHLRSMHKPSDTNILTGMPREDLLHSVPSNRDAALAKLSIDPTRPFVVWAPTFRTTIIRGKELWTEGRPFSPAESSDTPIIGFLQMVADKANVQIIVKPHPIEAAEYGALGFEVLTNEEIWGSGLSIYQFLGLSSGLMSDYSSMWVDYLSVDMPIGLICPDIDFFENGVRGLLPPSFYELAGGLFLNSADDLFEFFNSISNNVDFRQTERREVAQIIGFSDCKDCKTEELVEEIVRLGLTRRIYDAFDPVVEEV